MSGRSAYVRKKITEQKVKGPSGPDPNLDELHTVALGPARHDSARSGAANEGDVLSLEGSQSSGSIDGRRLDGGSQQQQKHPLDDFAYARARKPTIKAEDISGLGISKSGMRSVMDQNSEKVRKGIAKAFTFGGKKTRHDVVRPLETRPESSATVRPGQLPRSGEPEVSPLEDREQPNYPHANYAYDPQWEASLGPASPPPVAKLPPLPPLAAAPQIKRWIGTGRPVQRWNKLRKDPELWDPNGDVLIYLGHKGQNPRPNPSFRLSSHVIEATESRPLITMLREGSTEDEMSLAPSPKGAPPMLLPRQSSLSAAARDQMTGYKTQPGNRSGGQQPTPPLSEDTVLTSADGQISYEIFFSPPSNASKTDQVRYNVAIRNLFAILYHASLVGLSLYQALSDLHSRMEQFMPLAENDNLLTIIGYVGARGIDDVRNDAETAISLLAWCEDPKVRWEEGWRESFLHVAGMYGSNKERTLMESSSDFKRISPITKALLERASLEMHLRVQAAEEPLATFSFEDMWPQSLSHVSPASGPVGASPAKACADRLQRFFLSYYRTTWGRWPPPPPADDVSSDEYEEPLWLTRTVIQVLQKDFGALYDYLVNRDIIWDGSETRSSRKWLMVSESGNKAFEADTDELPMTDVLIEFDNKQRYPHLPHPYPLVPESIPPSKMAALSSNSKGRKRSKTGETAPVSGGGPQRPGAVERRIQLAYTEATNVYILGSDFAQTDLIDAFVKFEKLDKVGEIDPSLARRGRWVLIYGILQTLASVSADAPIVRYSEGVSYHLGPRLKGARLPPWAKKGKQAPSSIQPQEASHELSYCWLAPRAWNNSNTSASEEGGVDSQASDDNSPIDMRHGYSFPQPPPTPSSAGGRGTVLSSASAQSSRAPSASGQHRGYYPTNYAGSVTSYDAGSDAGTTSSWLQLSTTSSVTTAPPHGGRTSKASSRTGLPGGVARSTETLGSRRGGGPPSSRLDEREELAGGGGGGDWPMSPGRERGKLHISTAVDSSSSRAWRLDGSGSRKESFGVVREGEEDSDDQGWGLRRRHSRPLLSPSETSSVAQAIRDFDELDVDDIIPR